MPRLRRAACPLGDGSGGTEASCCLFATDGDPVAGAQVEVAVVPPPNGKKNAAIRPRTFATVTTDSQGRFAVDAVPAGVAKLRHSDGGVELSVSGLKGDLGTYHSIIAAPPSRKDGPWTELNGDPLAPMVLQFGRGEVSSLVPEREVRAFAGSKLTPLQAAVAKAVEAAPDARHEYAPGSQRTTMASLAATAKAAKAKRTCKKGYVLLYVPEDKYSRRTVPVQLMWTRKHSSRKYKYTTTGKTKLQFAFTGSNGNYAGGFTYAREKQKALSYLPSAGNKKKLMWRPEWEFRRWKAKCSRSSGGVDRYYPGVNQWRPNRLTTGGKLGKYKGTWKCDKKVRMSVTTVVAEKSTVVWNDFYKVGGVQLDVTQENSEEHVLTVIPDAKEKAPRICGNRGYPDQSDVVREIKG